MDKLKHWTGNDTDAFVHAIASDFVGQIETKLETERMSRRGFASLLHVSPGRVSQTLNDPSGFNLRTIVNYARVLGMKVSIVAYEDDDPTNDRGPISAAVFATCWRQSGRPQDLANFSAVPMTAGNAIPQRFYRLNSLLVGKATETKEITRAPIQVVIAETQKRYN